MSQCLEKKFNHYLDLTASEKELLERLEKEKVYYRSGALIRKAGSPVNDLYVIYEGWAFVSKNLDKNIRSVFDIKMSADFVGMAELSFGESLYDLYALTDVTICPFPKHGLNNLFQQSERLARLFHGVLSREQALLYERIASLGRRTALEKVAHFILEISLRLSLMEDDHSSIFRFPVSQTLMADLLGLSSVHVNRSMNELKRHGYIRYNREQLEILDNERLLQLADFDRRFLQSPHVDWHEKN
jgi:CRP-like cAMP-binding protein